MRSFIASVFRIIFKISFLKKDYFGLYKRVFLPFNLFKGVTKDISYRNGILLKLDLEDWIPQNIYFLNAYEEKEINFIEDFLKEGDCFIDVGANIGLFSLVASKRVGSSGKVIAFEPFKRNYRILCNHILMNQASNVQSENIAISNVSGKMRLHLNEKEKNFGMVSGVSNEHTYTEEAMTICLDAYMETKIKSRVHLIKIDIEGLEYQAILGMLETIERHKPTLLIEINPIEKQPQNEKIETLLFKMGYRKWFLDRWSKVTDKKEDGDCSNNYIFMMDNQDPTVL